MNPYQYESRRWSYYMSKLNEKLESYIKSQFEAPDHPVYHYTREQNYHEISRSKYLKLNSHSFLNTKDPTNKELQPAFNLICNSLKNHPELKDQANIFEKFIGKGIVYYTCSFSKKRSVINTSKYGNYCIEFNPQLLNHFPIISPALFSDVKYELNEQEKIITEIIKIYDQWKSSDKEQIRTLFLWIAIIMPLFKNNEHINDEECRIIQAEIYYEGKLSTPLVSKKIPFSLEDILNLYRE
jgi:hypothetical protein